MGFILVSQAWAMCRTVRGLTANLVSSIIGCGRSEMQVPCRLMHTIMKKSPGNLVAPAFVAAVVQASNMRGCRPSVESCVDERRK